MINKLIPVIFIVCAVSCYSQNKTKSDAAMTEYKTCFFSEEKYPSGYLNNTIIFGDEKFDASQNIVNQDNKNYKCIYFAIKLNTLQKGKNKWFSEDGSFELRYINNGILRDYKIKSPVEYTYDGTNITLSGTAILDEFIPDKNDEKVISFDYSGPVTSRVFVDLWSNISWKF